MPTVREIFEFLENRIPRELAAEWDRDGLMCCADLDGKVNRVLLCLDLTKGALEYAEHNAVDLCLTHHPFIFNPICGIDPDRAKGEMLCRLISSKISVLSYHTRFDMLKGGVNDVLASALGLSDIRVFGDGMGRVGKLPSCMDLDTFSRYVQKCLGAPMVRSSANPQKIESVAVLGGSGKSEWQNAMKSGADVFLTGEVGYSTMIDASNENFCVMEAGHDYTEKPAMKALGAMLCGEFSDIEIEYFDASVAISCSLGGNYGI